MVEFDKQIYKSNIAEKVHPHLQRQFRISRIFVIDRDLTKTAIPLSNLRGNISIYFALCPISKSFFKREFLTEFTAFVILTETIKISFAFRGATTCNRAFSKK